LFHCYSTTCLNTANVLPANSSISAAFKIYGGIKYTVLPTGRHSITVTVTDSSGHTASASTNILVSSKVALITGLSPGNAIAVGRTVTFSVVAPGFTSPSYTVFDANGKASVNGSLISPEGIFTWTPSLDDAGVHPIAIVVSDASGHMAQVKQTITVITPTVSIDSLRPGSAVGVGSSLSFNAHGNMLNSPSYSVVDSLRDTSSIGATNIDATGLFSWKPISTDLGLHTLTVTATDPAQNSASATIELVVTAAPTATDTPTPLATPPSSATPPVTTALPNTEKYLFITTLRVGSRGTAVTELQKRLITQGFLAGEATGYFGQMTSAAVKKFQKAHGLEPVGFVGPGTRKTLNNT
jgi:hypothetical protein